MRTPLRDDPQPFTLMQPLRRLLAAATPAECHAALAGAMRHLEDAVDCPISLVCEAVLSPMGQPEILWQAGAPGFLERDPAAFTAWFTRACTMPGRLVPFGAMAGGLAAASSRAGIVTHVAATIGCDAPPVPGLEETLGDLCAVAAEQLARLRQDEELRQRRSRIEDGAGRYGELLQASADILWRAGEDGTINVTRIFNGREDIGRLMQGRSLHTISAASGQSLYEMAARGAALRQVRADLGTGPLYITVCPLDCGPAGLRCHGAVSAGPDIAADRLAIDAKVLETMLGARAREDELRRETETMLMGIRTLLGTQSFPEKLEELAHLLQGAVRCGEVRVIQHRAGEPPRLLLPAGELPVSAARTMEMVLREADGRAVTPLAAASPEAAQLRAALGVPRGETLLVALPFRRERLYLLCSAPRGAGFSPRDLGLAERFSLLLQQAVMLRDDQTQMIHAAKLSALGQMSTSIAHELRQPLNTISIATQNIEIMLERGEVPPDMLKEKIARIQRQVERASKVMDRMRRFGRKSSGEIASVSLSAIAKGARALMDHVTERTGIAVELGTDPSDQVLADELEIEQVLVNLIQNAADAIAGHRLPGRPDGRIRIWWEADAAEPGTMQVHVDDNGPGFPPDVLEHALEAFFTTKGPSQGTGLGLSISHAILREHGGRLTLGNWDKGGRVTLYLRRPAPPSAVIIPLKRGRKFPEDHA